MAKRDFRELEKRIIGIYSKSKFLNLNVIGEVEHEGTRYNMYMYESKQKRRDVPNVCLAAGVHAHDELDATLGLLDFLDAHANDAAMFEQINLFSLPLINIKAYIDKVDEDDQLYCDLGAGKQTQTCEEVKHVEQAFGSRRFDLFVDSHGDPRYKGWYCYERKKSGLPSLGKHMESELRSKRLKIFRGNAKNMVGQKVSQGVINSTRVKEDTFEANMFKRGAAYSITSEYPGALRRSENRRRYTKVAVEAAISGIIDIYAKHKDKF